MAEITCGGGKSYLGESARLGGYPPPPQNEICAARSTETQNLIERGGQNIQHLSELTARLGSLSDRLLGPIPEKGQSKPTPSGSAVLLVLSNQAGDTSAILETLSGIVSRLEGV